MTGKTNLKRFLAILLIASASGVCAQQAFYDVTAADGNGLRFWQNDAYKIHMGDGVGYQYGPVTSYSIKMNMSNHSTRGWTWGVENQDPVAALNTSGKMQIAASFSVGPLLYSGSSIGMISASGPSAELSLSNRSVSTFVESPTNGERWVIYNNGPANDGRFRIWSGGDKFILTKEGNVGLGASSPGARLHIADGDLLLQNTSSGYPSLWLKNVPGTNTLKFDYNSLIHSGGHLLIRSGSTNHLLLNDTDGGNVGIGTSNPNQKLTVNGTIYGKEVKVDLSVPGPDYVFEKDYNLPSIEEIKIYIDQHKHLPEVPSAKEMAENGINVGEMNMILLRKIEELTLYVIEQRQEINELKKELNSPDLSGKKVEELTLHLIELKKEIAELKETREASDEN